MTRVPDGSKVCGESHFEQLCSLAYVLFATFLALDHVYHSGCITGCIALCVVSSPGDFASDRLLVNHFVVQGAVSVGTWCEISTWFVGRVSKVSQFCDVCV